MRFLALLIAVMFLAGMVACSERQQEAETEEGITTEKAEGQAMKEEPVYCNNGNGLEIYRGQSRYRRIAPKGPEGDGPLYRMAD
jgi:hypothetical protein